MDEQQRRLPPESTRTTLERTERVAQMLIGQTEEDARQSAETSGIEVRIARRDGRDLPLRADWQFSRVNLTIDGGVVTDAQAF